MQQRHGAERETGGKKAKLMLLVNEVTAAAGFLKNVKTSWF